MDAAARWLSLILHPFIVAVITLGIVLESAQAERSRTLVWFGIVLATTVVPLLARLSLRYWHLGRDFDMFHRHQRDTVYVLAVACMGVLVVVVSGADAPVLLRGAVYAVLPALLLAALINRFTKISVHAMVMAGCGMVCALLHPVLWAGVIALIVLLGWARVRLGRHTAVQVVLGWLVAAGSVALVFPSYLDRAGSP